MIVAYFVRHGQSMNNMVRRASGWSSTPLSPLGREQALATSKLFENVKLDKVYSSDLPRCVETCQLVLPGCEPELRASIREVSVGNMADRLSVEIRNENPEIYDFSRRVQDFSYYGGESNNYAYRRIRKFAEEELNTLPDGSQVAVFCHEGTIWHMLHYVLGEEIPLNKLVVGNGAIFKFVRFDDGEWKLAGWNLTGSL